MNLNEWVNTYINEISEDENDPQEITVGNYQTRYFHVCPGASTLYKDIESKGVDMDMAERSARLQDALYFVEEHIQRDGYEPDKDYVMVANNIAKNIMKMAKLMGLEEEHNYIQGHVDTIEKVVKEKGLEESIMNLTEKNTPTDPSKWAYYKAQAKKKFDVYPSAYANGWAAKKYKAAGGGWEKSKSESVKESVMSTLDLLKGESSDLKEFLKKVLSDSDFKDFKNDKEFHKFLKDFYINENMNEDTDIGHTDDEPDMLSSDLSVIARYASELEEMMDELSSKGTEIDLPHWWQAKIIKAKDYLVGAKHYLRAELEDGVTESSDGASEEEEYEFHKKLDTLVHNTFGKRSDEEKMNEAIEFSKQQLDTLRKNYSTINKINPSSPAYTKLIKLLNSLDNKALKQIANADVKFVSMLAKNRIKEGEEIEEYDVETLEELKDFHQFMKEYKSDINEGEYQGRDVELGKIMQGDVKKFKVYVNNDKGNVVKVNFGQKGMVIKKDNPDARKSFRARMNCDNPGPRWKARYWSCRKW